MLWTKRRLTWLVAPLAVFSLLAAACGDDEDAGTGSDTTEGDGGGGVSGEVNISGSSTVEPISVRVAELFEDETPDVVVNVDGPGTGDGFELFCDGETDISDASRPIDEEEAEACADNGIEFIEIKVAFDGLAVMTNPENDLECLNFADLYALVGPESDAESWSDAGSLAAELGSDTTFPDLPLEIIAPGQESGTYDSFIEIAIAGVAEEQGQEETTRTFPGQSDDNLIIQGIEGTEGGFGWVGYAFAANAGDGVHVVPVAAEPGGECVEPSGQLISDGSYPLSRSLYIYVNAAAADDNPAVAAYVDFYLGDGIEAVEEVGYVALPDDQLADSVDAWESRTTGTREA